MQAVEKEKNSPEMKAYNAWLQVEVSKLLNLTVQLAMHRAIVARGDVEIASGVAGSLDADTYANQLQFYVNTAVSCLSTMLDILDIQKGERRIDTSLLLDANAKKKRRLSTKIGRFSTRSRCTYVEEYSTVGRN